MFNKAQPPRPQSDDEGSLWYRTQPKNQKRMPRFFSEHQIIAAMRLYRAAREGAIPSGAAIGAIYEYVFFTPQLQNLVSKNTMGNCIIHSVIYEPRILKNKTRTGEGAWMTYFFRNPKDLEYGLEWQICAPLAKWFLSTGDLDKAMSFEEQRAVMQKELDDIANSEEMDFIGLYEKPIQQDSTKLALLEPEWPMIMAKYAERRIEVSDRPPELTAIRPPKPKVI